MAYPEENKLFAGDFLANRDEKRLIWFNYKEMELEFSSSYDGWAKYKEKVPDVSDANQNVETCNSELKFT